MLATILGKEEQDLEVNQVVIEDDVGTLESDEGEIFADDEDN